MMGARNVSGLRRVHGSSVMEEDLVEPVAQFEAAGVSTSTSAATTAPIRFDEFFDTEHVRLSRALYLLTGSASEADDLTQEAMVRVY